jgi:rhomboid protease GluP
MFERQRTGSVVCPSCGRLVGVNDPKCYSCGRPQPGMWGFAPLLRRLGSDLGFAKLTLTACFVLYLAMLATGGVRMGGLMNFMAPVPEAWLAFGASGSFPVLGLDRWWTLLSAGWLHGSLLHIGFNMYWLVKLAPQVGEAYGPGRMVTLYTASSVAGFALSTLWGVFTGGNLTLGASAAIFGLVGALVYAGRRTGSRLMQRQYWYYAVVLFAFGLLVRGVDNAAHLGGFLGGYGMGLLLDPLKPERLDHLLIAIVCLLATAAAVAASLLTPVPVF